MVKHLTFKLRFATSDIRLPTSNLFKRQLNRVSLSFNILKHSIIKNKIGEFIIEVLLIGVHIEITMPAQVEKNGFWRVFGFCF